MVDTSVLGEFNFIVYQYLPLSSHMWSLIEILFSIPVFLLTALQRVHTEINQSKNRIFQIFAVTISQTGIFIHMMFSILCLIDGVQNFTKPENTPHITSILLLFSLFAVKFGLLYSKKTLCFYKFKIYKILINYGDCIMSIPYEFDVYCNDGTVYKRQKIGTIGSDADTNTKRVWIRYFKILMKDKKFLIELNKFPWYPDFKCVIISDYSILIYKDELIEKD